MFKWKKEPTFDLFSDDEISYLLEKHAQMRKKNTIVISSKVDIFWKVNRDWVPSFFEPHPIHGNRLDNVFERYRLNVFNKGLKTTDYFVVDDENPRFFMTLPDFLKAYDKHALPINKRRRK